jgi:hypothetical protein
VLRDDLTVKSARFVLRAMESSVLRDVYLQRAYSSRMPFHIRQFHV